MKRHPSILNGFSVFNSVIDAVYSCVSSPNSEVTPIYTYIIMSLGSDSIRKGIRSSTFVVDKTLTSTGFSGIENTDWENIFGVQLN